MILKHVRQEARGLQIGTPGRLWGGPRCEQGHRGGQWRDDRASQPNRLLRLSFHSLTGSAYHGQEPCQDACQDCDGCACQDAVRVGRRALQCDSSISGHVCRRHLWKPEDAKGLAVHV